MIDRVAAAHHCVAFPKRLPCHAHARIEGRQIHLNAGCRSDSALARDLEPARRRIEVRLAITGFALRRQQSPCQTEVQSQILVDLPIVLRERTIQLPAAAGISAAEFLVMQTDRRPAGKKIRRRVAGELAGDHPESIGKSGGDCIQPIHAKGAAEANVVSAANHLDSVGRGPDIGATDERRVTAITQRPAGARQLHRRQAATVAFQIGVAEAREKVTSRNFSISGSTAPAF